MPSPGLSRGARLLRRWRELKRPVLVHPVRGVAGVVLIIPVLAMFCIVAIPFYVGKFAGRFFDWMHDVADCAFDAIGDWYADFLESKRERHLRFWARVRNGERPEGWHLDPQRPGWLIKNDAAWNRRAKEDEAK